MEGWRADRNSPLRARRSGAVRPSYKIPQFAHRVLPQLPGIASARGATFGSPADVQATFRALDVEPIKLALPREN